MVKLTGMEAVSYARRNGLTLNKYADSVEGERSGLSTREAREIVDEDPSLIWIEVKPRQKDTVAKLCKKCGSALASAQPCPYCAAGWIDW